MAIRTMKILEPVIFGEFIRKMAETPEADRPATVGALIAALNKMAPIGKTVVEFGTGYTEKEKVNYLQLASQKTDFTLVLPNAEDLKEKLPAGSYPLPDFYETMAFHTPPKITAGEEEKFRSARIADYSTAKCM